MDSCDKLKSDLTTRLKKIEGQVKGVQRMVEEEKYCSDILTQIAAVRAALDKVGTMIFENHSKSCLKKALEEGKEDQMVDDLVNVLKRFIR